MPAIPNDASMKVRNHGEKMMGSNSNGVCGTRGSPTRSVDTGVWEVATSKCLRLG